MRRAGTPALALAWCREREQFGRPIWEFGAIRGKLADVHPRLYAQTVVGG